MLPVIWKLEAAHPRKVPPSWRVLLGHGSQDP